MKVAVIGAGWAGLAAALELLRQGHHATVFESSHMLGGRARRSPSRSMNIDIDNGQHILLGAYRETVALMQSLGLDTDALFHRRPLTLAYADDSFNLSVAKLPAPLHTLAGVLRARGMQWSEKIKLVSIIAKLRAGGWRLEPSTTVAHWLSRHEQSEHMVTLFWRPLCVAALNTPIEKACAQLFANVLRDSLGGAKDAADLLIPAVDLSSLWPDHVQPHAELCHPGRLTMHRGWTVRRLEGGLDGVTVDGDHYDAAIVACNAPSTLRLLKTLMQPPRSSGDLVLYEESLAAFEYAPIATVTLQLEHPWGLPLAMLGLREKPARLQFGQWLFDTQARRADLSSSNSEQDAGEGRLLHIVISDAQQLAQHSAHDVINGTITQVREQTQRFSPMPNVCGHDLIDEKRATFIARPGLRRPTNRTPWSRVMVAGDWTDTGYPAVLEGAVRSGLQAARELAY
jgi:squalene-associated FAD-dependent desaturase